MLSSRRRFWNRKNSDTKLPEPSSNPEEQLPSVTHLTGAKEPVRRVIFIAERNLVVAASWDDSVRVYDIDTSGEPFAIFQRHEYSVYDVVQLESDLVASVGWDGRLFTWKATTVEMVGEWKHVQCLLSVAKLGESKIIVGCGLGNLAVLTHQSGSSLQVLHHLPKAHCDWINNITVHSDMIATCSSDCRTRVWDTTSLTLRATLPHDNGVYSIAVSERNVVTACLDGKIRVFENGHDFNLLFDLPIDDGKPDQVAFLNDDTFAVAAARHLYFVSLPTKSILSREQLDDKVCTFSVLSDGRIAVGGGKPGEFVGGKLVGGELVGGELIGASGYCAIVTPPRWAQGAVEEWVVYSNPRSAIACARAPLRAAWLAIQKHQLTHAEACKTAITSENCASSLDEWCIAHDLLMEAVKRGEIPASRHLHDSIAHWHQVLYQHCAKLATGKKTIGAVKLLFKEAEIAGVIATGQIESLINTIGVRKDMDADNRFIVHATYRLFMRQAEMDVRLRQVLHYQRVQQVTAVFNALIGCIPVGGAILTNVLSGGASILKDMDVCGLVESVLGIGKDVSGGFRSDSLVDRVLRKSNAVLSVEEWENIPFEKRKVVEDAATNLGLGIDELREKLQIVASMQACEDGTPSEQVVIEEVEEDTKIQPVISTTNVSAGVASLSVEDTAVENTGPAASSATTTGLLNGDELELKRWEKEGVSKKVLAHLKRAEVAACFAAFLVDYECDSDGSFSKEKEAMQELFKKNRISGTTFVESDEDVKKAVVHLLVVALTKDTDDENAMKVTEFLVKQFVRKASQ